MGRSIKNITFRSLSCVLFACILLSLTLMPALSVFAQEESPEDTDRIMVGIDVSTYNGDIDWANVKADGVEFAMVRICSRAGNNSEYLVDTRFDANVRGARAQGIHVGAYFFSYAESVDAVREEAEMVVEILNQYPDTFSFPIVFDAEEGDPEDGFDIRGFAAEACRVFCEILSENGYYPMIYASTNWFNTVILPASEISEYPLWQADFEPECAGYTPAQIASAADLRPNINENDENVRMWQLTNRGKVDGISENVDLDICYFDFSKVILSEGLNGFHVHDCLPTYDEEGHYLQCECGYTDPESIEEHALTDGVGEAGHLERCACGFERLLSEHVFDRVGYDEFQHWAECECQYKKDEQNHEIINGACIECGYVAHVYSTEHDCINHWKLCEMCGEKSGIEAHISNFDGSCAECGALMHNYELRSDASGHRYVCTLCDVAQGESEHSFYNGVCGICAYKGSATPEKNNDKKAEKESPEGGFADFFGGCTGSVGGVGALIATSLCLSVALKKKKKDE